MKRKNKIMAGIISLFLVLTPLAAMKALAVNDTVSPSTPTNLVTSLNSGNQVFLHWNASTDNTGVSGYTIIRNGSVLANTVGTSYVDVTVSPSTSYTYSVLAFDASGNISGMSASAVITTLATSDIVAPSAPSSLTATSSSPTQVNLNWASSTDNVLVIAYVIIRNGSVIANTSSSSYSDMSVIASTTYTYSVLAFDAAGNISPKSNEVVITTPAPISSGDVTAPSTPMNLMAVAATSTVINLSWTVSSDNVAVTGYNIYRNGSLIGSSSSNTFSNAGLNPSTLYTYYVRAFDAAGNISNPSNISSAKTLGVKVIIGKDDDHDEDANENKNEHENKGLHLGQIKNHINNGNHFGQLKQHTNKENHFGQIKNDE